MTQALFVHAAKDLRLGDIPTATPGPGEVRIAMRRGGICGSDLHYFNHGGFGAIRLREPMVLGHEVSGEVVELGEGVTGLAPGDLVVLDSGGQYRDGTTDITRTLRVGNVGDEGKRCYTRVLQGMIALSRIYFPKGRTGRDLDPIARYPLFAAHQDFNHGTGHGVGAYLSVHEGPQRFNAISDIELLPGMILSNEPGYYREGAFGIRLENLIVVQKATCPDGGDADRDMLSFETLTFVPFDRDLILPDMLSGEERAWLNNYHVTCVEKLSPLLGDAALRWLKAACAPI